MCQQYRQRPLGNSIAGLFNIISTVVVRIIDACKIDRLTLASQRHLLVQQHANAHRLHRRDHTDRVVIAQHTVYLTLKMGTHLLQTTQGGLIGAIGLRLEVAGQYTQVIIHMANGLNQYMWKVIRHIEVQIGKLQYREGFKSRRQPLQRDVIVADPDLAGIAPCPAMQQYQPQAVANNGTQRVPVFDMEEISALTEYPALEVTLYSKALLEMNPAYSLLQPGIGRIIERWGCHPSLSGEYVENSMHTNDSGSHRYRSQFALPVYCTLLTAAETHPRGASVPLQRHPDLLSLMAFATVATGRQQRPVQGQYSQGEPIMNLEKVFFAFFIVLALTLNFGFFIGGMDNPNHHNVYELFAALVVSLIATVMKFGDRAHIGAVLLATSLVADLQLIAAVIVWTLSVHASDAGMTPMVLSSIVSLSGGALLANITSVVILVTETVMFRR